MDGYICTKACTLSTVEYLPGEPIPAGAVLGSRVRALIRQGYITPVNEAPAIAEVAEIPPLPLHTPDGTVGVTLTPQELVQLVEAAQLPYDEARIQFDALPDEVMAVYCAITDPVAGKFSAPIITKEGTSRLPVSFGDVMDVIAIVQMPAADAAKAAAALATPEAVQLLDALDSRKMVKDAAKARAEALHPNAEGGKGDA